MKRITPFLRIFFGIIFIPIIISSTLEKDSPTITSNIQAGNKLNIVFFLVDDLGWMDVGFRGSKLYETPNIDQLASEGVIFQNAYAAYPRCVPSRYAMITGRFPARDHIPGSATVKATDYTVANAFKDGGYKTFFAGKWHLANDNIYPENAGFDINIGGGEKGAPQISYFYPYGLDHGLENGNNGEFLTERLTDETVEFINANSDTSFFVYLSHYAVHTPLEAKQGDIDYFDTKIDGLTYQGDEYIEHGTGQTHMWHINPTYAAMVYAMDKSLGDVIQALKNNGIYDSTVIIFTSDHGGLSNRGYNTERVLPTSNAPLRGGKGHLYEGGIRVPVVIRWPGVSNPGTVSNAIITGTDYYPTMLDMVDLPQYPESHVDGQSFTWALKNEPNPNPDRILYWHNNAARPYSTGDMYSSAIMQGEYKLIDLYDMREQELYHITLDSAESNDICGTYPAIRDSLFNLLTNWRNNIDALDNVNHENPYYSLFKNNHFEYGSDINWNLVTKNDASANVGLSNKDNAEETAIPVKKRNACYVNVSSSSNLEDVCIESDAYDYNLVSDGMEISFYAKDINPGNMVKASIEFIQGGITQTISSQTYSLSSSYNKYVFEFNLPYSGMTTIKLKFYCGNSSGDIYIDNVIASAKDNITTTINNVLDNSIIKHRIVEDKLIISELGKSTNDIRIYDMMGKLVYKTRTVNDNKEAIINLSKLTSGCYITTVYQENKSRHFKFIYHK